MRDVIGEEKEGIRRARMKERRTSDMEGRCVKLKTCKKRRGNNRGKDQRGMKKENDQGMRLSFAPQGQMLPIVGILHRYVLIPEHARHPHPGCGGQ